MILCDDGVNECESLWGKLCRFSHSLSLLSSKQFAGAKNKEELVWSSQLIDYN